MTRIRNYDRINRFVDRAVEIANDDSHGYSQYWRWGPDYDCSSMMYECAYFAGYPVSYEDPRYTGAMIDDFVAAGYRCDVFDGNLGDLERGDILLNTAAHTAVYIGDGLIAEASIDENGGIEGYRSGDQTGWEIHICGVYNYPGGWTHVLTPPEDWDEDSSPQPVPQPESGILHGIDVSSHDEAPFKLHTEMAYGGADFVIVKITQGTWYENPCFDYAYNRAKSDGKLLGIYHYAANEGAREEAEFFFEHVKGRIGEFLPVLDWESYNNEGNWGNTNWCREFCDRFHELSGIWPAIYVQASAIWQCENCSDVSPLWVAGYPGWAGDNWDPEPGDMPYDIGAWNNWTIWQYTSDGGTDRNVANISAAGWQQLCGQEEIVTPQDKQDIARMTADEILGRRIGEGGFTVENRIVGTDIAANNVNNGFRDGWIWDGMFNRPLGEHGFTLEQRIVGTDIAANNVNNHLGDIMKALEAIGKETGADVSKIAAEVQRAVAESLEKIELEVKVNK